MVFGTEIRIIRKIRENGQTRNELKSNSFKKGLLTL